MYTIHSLLLATSQLYFPKHLILKSLDKHNQKIRVENSANKKKPTCVCPKQKQTQQITKQNNNEIDKIQSQLQNYSLIPELGRSHYPKFRRARTKYYKNNANSCSNYKWCLRQ